MTEDEAQSLVKRSRALLDDSVRNVDPSIDERLREARQKALRHNVQDQRTTINRTAITWNTITRKTWLPAAAAAIGFVAVSFYFDKQPSELPDIYRDPVQQQAAENMELLDDLEFMVWLVQEETPDQDDTPSS